MSVVYLDKNVYEAAVERVNFVFDHFENISVSISSGKDSTVLFHLCLNEAVKRNRKIRAFFLDQEAEYQSSIDWIEKVMVHPNVIPEWYQVPIFMTNATSYQDEMLYSWGEGQKWMREKHPLAIHKIDVKYPTRFYQFFNWYETQQDNCAIFVGIRAAESLNRFRAVTKSPGYEDVLWSTKTKKAGVYRFYPIYDWGMGDIWRFIHDEKIEYNRIYDKMYSANKNFYNTMRVSNLIHEKSFKCLLDLQTLEPETYDKLVARLGGVHCASIYAGEDTIFSAKKLPERFATWKEFRDYLLSTTPIKNRDRFLKRFDSQPQTRSVYQQQCKQIMINDWENNISVDTKRDTKKEKKDVLSKWWDIL